MSKTRIYRYPRSFTALVERINEQENPDLKFIGFGNPRAKILLVGKKCAIDRSTPRGERCYAMEQLENAIQWSENVRKSRKSYDVEKWVGSSSFDEKRYNPLYPYKGQLNRKAVRDTEGCAVNGGTSATWYAYQKLMNGIFKQSRSTVIDFHENAFTTNLSTENVDSLNTKNSIEVRCESLLSDKFFSSFPIVIVGCGRYTRQYDVNLEKVFKQKYLREERDEVGWMRIYEKKGRLLIHTSPLARCSDSMIDRIAKRVRDYLEKPFLKYCVYYDGTQKSVDKCLMAYYERFWIWEQMSNRFDDQGDVKEMIMHGIEEEWIDSFNIPRSLVGIFFNRYTHWTGYWKKDLFKEWFENVRAGNMVLNFKD